METCDQCDGKGYKYIQNRVQLPRGRFADFPIRTPCICLKNEQVKKYKQLKDIGYMNQKLVDSYRAMTKIKFMIFLNSTPTVFYKLVKIRLLSHPTSYEKKLIVSSNEFTEQFFLPTEDHADERRVSDNSYFDFIFLTLDSGIQRPSTKKVIQELINYRILEDNPIWIATRHDNIRLATEYTDELGELLGCFTGYDLTLKKRVDVIQARATDINGATT